MTYLWHRRLWVAAFGLVVAIAPAIAQTVDPKERARLLTEGLSQNLPDFAVKQVGDSAIVIKAPTGDSIDFHISPDLCSREALAACADRMIPWYSDIFRMPDIKSMRITVSLFEFGTFTPFGINIQKWRDVAFGSYQQNCLKNDKDTSYPITSWDGRLLKKDPAGLGDVCRQATRDRLGPIADNQPLPSDGIGIMSGRDEASRTILLDEWSGLSKRFEGKLLIAIPDPDTILYADGRNSDAMETLSRRARDIIAAKPRSNRLGTDVFIWAPTDWKLASSHATAEHIISALKGDLPDAKLLAVDDTEILMALPKEQTRVITFTPIDQICESDVANCDQQARAFAAQEVQLLQQRPTGN